MNQKCTHCGSEGTEFLYVTVNPNWHLEGYGVWRCNACGQEFTANVVETSYEEAMIALTDFLARNPS